jgi:preprotein translocase subunit SecG
VVMLGEYGMDGMLSLLVIVVIAAALQVLVLMQESP